MRSCKKSINDGGKYLRTKKYPKRRQNEPEETEEVERSEMTEERRRIEEMRNELEQEKERHEREVSELEEARRDWEKAKEKEFWKHSISALAITNIFFNSSFLKCCFPKKSLFFFLRKQFLRNFPPIMSENSKNNSA